MNPVDEEAEVWVVEYQALGKIVVQVFNCKETAEAFHAKLTADKRVAHYWKL